jgi:general secretion pathway protein G
VGAYRAHVDEQTGPNKCMVPTRRARGTCSAFGGLTAMHRAESKAVFRIPALPVVMVILLIKGPALFISWSNPEVFLVHLAVTFVITVGALLFFRLEVREGGIVLDRIHRAAWDNVTGAVVRSVLSLQYLKVVRRKGWPLWIPLYYRDQRDLRRKLLEGAPAGSPITMALLDAGDLASQGKPRAKIAKSIVAAALAALVLVVLWLPVFLRPGGRISAAFATFLGIEPSERVKCTIARADLTALEVALKLFRLDNGFYPSTAQGLNLLLDPPPEAKKSGSGGYVRAIPTDAWGHAYEYRNDGARIWLRLGGSECGDDGVHVWEEQAGPNRRPPRAAPA